MQQSVSTGKSGVYGALTLFRALISGALDELQTLLGDAVSLVMETIELHVQRFFVQALQLAPRTLRMEAK